MRHAFLIIAHDNPEILYAQLEALDSENNDFYYHLDKRMNIKKIENLLCQSPKDLLGTLFPS